MPRTSSGCPDTHANISAASINVSSGPACLVCNNLNTGQITTGSSAGNTTAPSTPNGSHIFNSFNSVAQMQPYSCHSRRSPPWGLPNSAPKTRPGHRSPTRSSTTAATATCRLALLLVERGRCRALIGAAAMQGRLISKASGSAIAGSAAILAQLQPGVRQMPSWSRSPSDPDVRQDHRDRRHHGQRRIDGPLNVRMAWPRPGCLARLVSRPAVGAGSERAGPRAPAPGPRVERHAATAVLAGRAGLTVLTLVRRR